jgi:predicted NBD/HSP70 family sugar kinase
LQRLDAIGISSAGIYVNNEVRVASLFRRVARGDFDARIRNIYSNLGKEWGVPVEVANDGDVAALAGAMELGRGPLLGLALGTSLAAGFVDSQRRVLGWLNELAFAPNDLAENAPIDSEWSLDRGTAVQYLSQDAALRLALESGLELAPGTRAERLAELSRRATEREPSALLVFESLGVYLGYALLDYAEFYGMRDVLLLGRVTSGVGGGVLVSAARRVLETEAPELFAALNLHLPNEAQRRVGQAIAAASLPTLTASAETP